MKLIELSMRPSLLYSASNTADPASVFLPHALVQGEILQREDYGYSIDLGFTETRGFLRCDPQTLDRRSVPRG